MSYSSSVKQLKDDFRSILRHFKKLPSLSNKASPLRLHVIKKFHEGKLETDKRAISDLIASANSYAKLVTSINKLSFLRGLDSGERLDPRDKIMATARRVGLSVPSFAEDLDLNKKVYKFDPNIRTYF